MSPREGRRYEVRLTVGREKKEKKRGRRGERARGRERGRKRRPGVWSMAGGKPQCSAQKRHLKFQNCEHFCALERTLHNVVPLL